MFSVENVRTVSAPSSVRVLPNHLPKTHHKDTCMLAVVHTSVLRCVRSRLFLESEALFQMVIRVFDASVFVAGKSADCGFTSFVSLHLEDAAP